MTVANIFNVPLGSSNDTIVRTAHTIHRNTKAIVDAVQARRQSANPGQKIVLGVGELHANSLHIMQQIDVLNALREKGLNCATTIEWPSNNIDLHIEEIFKAKRINKAGLRAMMEAKENSPQRNRLSAETEPIRTSNARLSRALMHEFMDHHDIPVFCTDALRDWELYVQDGRKAQHLLASDPRVMAAIEEAIDMLNLPDNNGLLPPIASLKQLGMLARNIYALNEIDAILQENPDIDAILLEAGRAHITGNDTLKPEPSLYEHGLANLFASRNNHAFIAAPLHNSVEDRTLNTPQQAFSDPQILWLDYLEAHSFNARTSETSDLDEADLIKSLGPFLPYIDQTLDGRSPIDVRKQRKRGLRAHLQTICDHNGLLHTPAPNGFPRLEGDQ